MYARTNFLKSQHSSVYLCDPPSSSPPHLFGYNPQLHPRSKLNGLGQHSTFTADPCNRRNFTIVSPNPSKSLLEKQTYELVYPGNCFNRPSSILCSFGHPSWLTRSPKRLVSCVNEAARRSGLAWDATWRMKHPKLFFSSKLAELKTPPVRSPTLTPEKELVVPVLLWNR
jgi:hypothetical protein